ncbi:MAG: hypothetical protein H8E47_14450 [Anaerolineales bacterium]|nr:hypothetical protein [Anaerolineales bacterium]
MLELLRRTQIHAASVSLSAKICVSADLEESAAYVKHHLRVAGVNSCPFSDSFIATAHQFSHGVARQLNRVCLNGLLIGLADRKKVLDETDAKRAILELGRAG